MQLQSNLTMVVAALALSACAGRELPPIDAASDTTTIAAPANRPRFSDTDPHEWQGRAPSAYPVHGIDASRWQGDIDWPFSRDNGVSFAFVKATEGGDVIDPSFARYWQDAARAGIPRGAYHYYYFCRPAIEQARWFIRNVPRSPGALPPVLDMEWTPFSRTCTKRPEAALVRREAATFLAALERHYGQRPIIYTTVDFYHENQMWRVPGAEFWLRSVAGHPSQVYPSRTWRFWQYSGTGLVPGITGEVDLNAFSGSAADWQNWLARHRR